MWLPSCSAAGFDVHGCSIGLRSSRRAQLPDSMCMGALSASGVLAELSSCGVYSLATSSAWYVILWSCPSRTKKNVQFVFNSFFFYEIRSETVRFGKKLYFSRCGVDVSRMCHGCVTDVSRKCHGSVTEVSRKCHGSVTEVSLNAKTRRTSEFASISSKNVF